MQISIATTNPGKLRDFQHPADAAIQITPLPGLHTLVAPEETGETFEANSRLKAVYYSQFAPDTWVLADDSGIEVSALEGRPGVRSANFAEDVGYGGEGTREPGEPALTVDQANNAALQLATLEATDRACRYHCVLALARNGVVHHVAHGTCEGQLLSDPEGTGGFGYDPLVLLPRFNRTMAQLTPDERLEVSHRGAALRALIEQIRAKATHNL